MLFYIRLWTLIAFKVGTEAGLYKTDQLDN